MYKLDQYVHLESAIHKRDPRVKIIAVIALSIIILNVNIIGILAATGMSIAISQMARISPPSLFRSLRPVFPFFFCLFLMYAFFTPGHPLPPFPIGPVQITYQGLQLGLLQVFKFVLLIVAASILTMTTSQSEITMGLERLLRPLKFLGISSHNIAMMVSLALRFMPTLLDEMNNISEAQLARGANFNPRHTTGRIRAITYLAAPLSVSIFRRCDDLIDAMEARGYHQGPRTYLREPVLTRTDYWLIGALLLLIIAVLVWHP